MVRNGMSIYTIIFINYMAWKIGYLVNICWDCCFLYLAICCITRHRRRRANSAMTRHRRRRASSTMTMHRRKTRHQTKIQSRASMLLALFLCLWNSTDRLWCMQFSITCHPFVYLTSLSSGSIGYMVFWKPIIGYKVYWILGLNGYVVNLPWTKPWTI